MTANELINALKQVVDEHGDVDVNISCVKQSLLQEGEQAYLMSEPQFVVVEEYDTGKEVSIRNWPY